jgi:RNA methyltransferase, TrmH family
MLSDSNARLVAARRLTSPRGRRESRLFLAEGRQAVSEAVLSGRATEVFGTGEMIARYAELFADADVSVDAISVKAAASLSETVNPQGLIAVTRMDRDDHATGPGLLNASVGTQLVVVLVDANDPGNAGTILRTADAAGASTVIFAGQSVDPYNGKCVRASAGSLFHVGVRVGWSAADAIAACRAAGLLTLATSGAGEHSVDELADAGRLATPTAWLFGNEARGLDEDVLELADLSVRVPIYGRAESLNLAAAAAVCLYASAREIARQ